MHARACIVRPRVSQVLCYICIRGRKGIRLQTIQVTAGWYVFDLCGVDLSLFYSPSETFL